MKADKLKNLIDKMDISNMLIELLLGDGYKGVLRDMIKDLQQDERRILKAAFRDVVKNNSYEIENAEQKSIEKKISGLEKDSLQKKYSKQEIMDSIQGIFDGQICDAVAEQYLEKRKDMDELFDLTQTSKESLKLLEQISRNDLHQLSAGRQYTFFALELKADTEEAEEFRNIFSDEAGFDYEEIYLSESERGNEFTMVRFEFWEEKDQHQFMEFIDQLNKVMSENDFRYVGWEV